MSAGFRIDHWIGWEAWGRNRTKVLYVVEKLSADSVESFPINFFSFSLFLFFSFPG